MFREICEAEDTSYDDPYSEMLEGSVFEGRRILETAAPYPKLYEFLIKQSESQFYRQDDSIFSIREKYGVFTVSRDVIRRFAEAADTYLKFISANSGEGTTETLIPDELSSIPINGLELSPRDIRAEIIDGKITFSFRYPIYEALRDVEVSRLRICPICQKIFWAYRITSTGCCKQHSTAMRTRKWREGKKETEEKLKNHFQPRNKK